MPNNIWFYPLIFILLSLLAITYAKLAKKWNIVDIPNARSSHSEPIIRGGGILFFLAALLFFIISGFQYPGFIVSLSILAILSFTDDLLTLDAKVRMPFQFLAVFVLFYSLNLFALPIWSLLLIAVIAVGFINIYNFMDGINGITGLYSLAIFFGFWLLNNDGVTIVSNDLLLYTIFSLIIFGYFNFRKQAKFFAGDVGSVSIAGIILFVGIKLIIATHSPLIIGLVLVYGVDAGYTILRRLLKKENIFAAHRRHLYQAMVDNKKIPHLKVAVGYAIVQLLINTIIYFSMEMSLGLQYVVFASLFFVGTILYFLLLKWARPSIRDNSF